MNISAKTLCIVVAVVGTVRALPAQPIPNDELRVRKLPYTPRNGYSFQADANLVEVGVIVRDNLSRIVPGLQKENFRIFESGVEHKITSFAVQTSSGTANGAAQKTRHVALVFDDIVQDCRGLCKGIRIADFQIMKTAAQQFVRQGLSKGDQVSLFGFSAGQALEFTGDPERLATAIANLEPRIQEQKTVEETLGEVERYIRYLGRLPGDRMLLLASRDLGGDNFYLNGLIALALQADVTINCIDTKGLTEAGLNGNLAMARMAEETGGEYFSHNNNMLRGMRETMAPEVKYLLGFERPDIRDGRYHPLKVKLTGTGGHNYEVAARPGYFAPSADETRPGVSMDIDQAVLAADSRTDIASRLTLESHSLDPLVPVLNATAHLDLKSIAFREEKARHNQRLTFVAVLFDSQGRYVDGSEAVIDFTLRRPTLQHLRAAGINCTLRLAAPHGTYRLRTVIREAGGAMTTTDEAVEIQ